MSERDLKTTSHPPPRPRIGAFLKVAHACPNTFPETLVRILLYGFVYLEVWKIVIQDAVTSRSAAARDLQYEDGLFCSNRDWECFFSIGAPLEAAVSWKRSYGLRNTFLCVSYHGT